MSAAPVPVRFRALGTTAVVAVTDPEARDDAAALLRDELDAIDRACSRFRDDSELVKLNHAGGAAVDASPLLRDALEVAIRAARLTDGLVDPSVGRAMRVLGYDRDFATVATTGDALQVRVEHVPGWQVIDIDHTRGTVRVPKGVELDLGATAKAFAADRAAERIAAATGAGVIVSLGGDCALGGTAPAGGWTVHVTDRHDAPDAPGQTVHLTDGALATSGTSARRWQRGDDLLHHVLDPTTGLPAPEVWRTVSVAAATCVDANVASTAAIILGAAAPAWLEARALPARLVRPDSSVVVTAGWPADPVAAGAFRASATR